MNVSTARSTAAYFGAGAPVTTTELANTADGKNEASIAPARKSLRMRPAFLRPGEAPFAPSLAPRCISSVYWASRSTLDGRSLIGRGKSGLHQGRVQDN